MRSISFRSFFLMASVSALSAATPARRKVVVSGAGGQTGQHLFRKMLALPEEFDPVGLVRSEESKAALIEAGGVPESAVRVVDVTNTADVQKVVEEHGSSAFCICSSAKPAPTGEMNEESGRPVFGFPNGMPEQVDWIGQKNQIDACTSDTHVVICSSMGGTDPNNFLNTIGRTTNSDGTTSGGNIIMWKRKAEMYLIDSGRPYTIVHPGGLIDEPGSERELVLGVDDSQEGTESRTVPREDVAEVMLQALKNDAYVNRSFDLRAKPVDEEDASPTTDFQELIESLNGKNCDYTLGESM
uniref:NAD(P)-binding domain-containing protein n=1 Tax=Chaetoceros debilis TaxID=122233 RepID=A0A7S3V6N0_9STRA|mmetsp:Transcript_7721/g.11072  ORF Transcript_7721/g.11072 Transcript_7721/m.11072 type:complete len:299 (+) Transcript_7721:36-932(+)